MRSGSGRIALGERLRIVATTAAVTAILTSVGWLAFGGRVIDSVANLAVLRTVDAPANTRAVPGARPAPSTTTLPPPITATSVRGYVIPVADVRPDQLTDTFADARAGGARIHDAIDIMAPRGTPVLAATAGRVERLFTSDAGGLTIYIRSPDRRTITYYAHLDAYARGLAEGQQVRSGQQLGTVGSTGNADASAPHLHFAIMQTTPDADWWEPATAINPYPILSGQR